MVSSLHRRFGGLPRCTLCSLFGVVMRLMPLALPIDRLTLYGDYRYYYELAAYSDQGLLPFINYWSEYPPIFPFLSVGIYRLSQWLGGGYPQYATLLGLLMIGVESANLVLVLRLARRLYRDSIVERIGWFYSLLFVPILYTWWHFDALNTLALLWALDLLWRGRDRLAGVLMGLGALIKLLPMFVLLPLVLRTRPRRHALECAGAALAVVGAGVLPLLIAGGPIAIASFREPLQRSSWQTVWALLDGNLWTGAIWPASDHFVLEKAAQPVGNPSWVPDGVRLFAFGTLFLTLFWRARLQDAPHKQVAFVALTLVIFFLWSDGWSPQWQTLLFPLVLLAFPSTRGLLFVLVLGLVNLAEWPLLLSRGLVHTLYVTVTVRTLLLLLLAVELWRRIVVASDQPGRMLPEDQGTSVKSA